MKRLGKIIIDSTFNDRWHSIFIYNYMRIKVGRAPRLPNLKNPNTFNEKVLWLKLYHRQENANLYADKFAVREFVSERVGKEYLIPLIGVLDDPGSLNVAKLPNSFVLKPNHASGLLLLCNNKEEFNVSNFINLSSKWLSIDYSKSGREYQYSGIPRKILIEEMLIDTESEGGLRDYKFFCFNGEPRFVQVDLDRFSSHRRNFYDLNWDRLPFGILYPQYQDNVERPILFNEMIDIARVLSRDFLFSRVDLYQVGGKIYFGEITFHPEGGTGPFFPEEYDKIVGSFLSF